MFFPGADRARPPGGDASLCAEDRVLPVDLSRPGRVRGATPHLLALEAAVGGLHLARQRPLALGLLPVCFTVVCILALSLAMDL